MFQVMFKMLRRPNEATAKNAFYKTVRKQNKSIKIVVLKWIPILSLKGFTWAAKSENYVTIYDRDPLTLNPVKPGAYPGLRKTCEESFAIIITG